MPQSHITLYDPQIVGAPARTFSQVAVSHGIAFLAGQAALDENDQVVAPGDTYGQTVYALNRARLILEELGTGLDHVVSATVFITPEADFNAYNSAWIDSFAGHRPARATMIAGLVLPGCLVEIILTAALTHQESR